VTTSTRAAPLSPDERRVAILEAVVPLVRERGLDVTTRELAAAAGVAEGTLFRVFPDKSSLVIAAAYEGLTHAAGAADSVAEIDSIEADLPLEDRLIRVIELGQRRMGQVVQWMSVLRRFQQVSGGPSAAQHEKMHDLRHKLEKQGEAQRAATSEAIGRLLAPDADRLRVSVEVAVMLVESAVIGTHLRAGFQLSQVPAQQVADVLVHGLVRPLRPTDPNPATREP
jgi:AcrR family transcriptional regulator